MSNTATGPQALRTQFAIPTGTATDIELVQDDSICEAVTVSLEAKGWPHQTQALVVVRLAGTHPFYLAAQRTDSVIGSAYLLNDLFSVIAEFGGH
jgi:hypothetical protein